jgi:SAM-dependent methyltransferase
MALKGYLDEVTLRSIRGWATAENGGPESLIASVNGVVVARFEASLYRPDLVNFARKEVGFEVDLEQPVKPGDIVTVTNDSGEHLIGSPKRIRRVEASREEKTLWLVSREMKILEIGPSYSPFAPRSKGWNSFSLDHATQEELRSKYHDFPVVRIEPVDYVWKGGPIDMAIPAAEHGSFDAIIASHVIEHIPDPIGFFLSASVLLREDGFISLVIPDKRTMFDFFKPVTVTSDYLEAHYRRRTRHSKKTAFNNFAFNVHEKAELTWSTRAVGEFTFFVDELVEAKRAFDQTIEEESAPYVDFHCTVYTQSSFALIILELSQLGVLPFTIARTFPTAGCEFYVTLQKRVPAKLSNEELREERLRLMKAAVRELGQQARWLLDD